MKKSIIKTIALSLSAFALLALSACNNSLGNDELDLTLASSVLQSSSNQYGSLSYSYDVSRGGALNVADISTAVVTVVGNGITSTLSAETSVTSGSGSVTINNIPVGKNRIVKVQGRDSSGNNISDALIMSLVDINAGANSPSINWETSRRGYVYNKLFESNINIRDLSDSDISAIDNAIPAVDATNIDIDLFATDFASGVANLKDKSQYIKSSSKTLKRLVVAQAASSTATAPVFTSTAYYSDGTNEDVTSSATWTSSVTTVASVNAGSVTLLTAGTSVVTASYTYASVTKTGATQTITVTANGGNINKLYFIPSTTWSTSSPRYAAYFFEGSTNEWVSMTLDSDSGYYVCSKPETAYTSVIFCRMNPSTTENIWGNKWNQTADLTIPSDKDTYQYADGAWDEGSGEWLSDLTGTYSGGSLTCTVTAGPVTDPDLPTVTISPAAGEISTASSITITYEENNATVTAATVTITGAVSKTYSLSDFTNKTLTIKVGEGGLGITEAGKAISVSASATNSEGTKNAGPIAYTSKVVTVNTDTFTWDNANVYFVIQDRFYDGDSSNNNSYGRMSTDDLGKTIGTFHGGDIKGLTQKLDYLNGLGINAIWITAPYEQTHGWCGGGSNGDFAHYAYHGYYPLDYTMIDKNMGTVEEFRTFVTECHKRGIRVVMDIVMNHPGYLTLQDCQDYNLDIFSGSYSGGKSIDMGFKIGSDGSTYHAHHSKIDYSGHTDGWAKWWGSSWIRAGIPGYTAGGGDDLTKNLDDLPDVKTENTTAQTAAPILQTKWAKETSGYDNWIVPAASSLRNTTDTYAPAVWIEKWLAAWVEEFGIDGFRCDTAKHVDMYRWGELKALCKTALETWRSSNRVDEYAKDWDEDFWMTGECFGWKYKNGGDWFSTGGFDTMIDFSANGGSLGDMPSWESRTSNRQGLLYISSHDTSLGRWSDQLSLGTQFVLTPGPIQIYYGDETARAFGETGSDPNQGTRSDMNWSATTGDCAKHWGKLGTFRKFNPAVGAGSISGSTRTYNDNQVVISTSSTTVSVPYSDGTTVYNWYDGTSATVSSGSVTFSSSSASTTAPVLCSDRNPADYGVSF
ncbi:MAG: hypothetical protein K6F15_02195 [Treponema sp.]|nr:hypothetical protein [Treponema sp.]